MSTPVRVAAVLFVLAAALAMGYATHVGLGHGPRWASYAGYCAVVLLVGFALATASRGKSYALEGIGQVMFLLGTTGFLGLLLEHAFIPDVLAKLGW